MRFIMNNNVLSDWEMAIDVYMFHLNMTREEACYALGIKYTDSLSTNRGNETLNNANSLNPSTKKANS